MTGNTGNTLGYEVARRVIASGGHLSGTPDGMLIVENADDVVVILTAATTFVLDYDAGYKGGDLSVARERLEAAAAKSYQTLRAAHVADYCRYFDRVTLELRRTIHPGPRMNGSRHTKLTMIHHLSLSSTSSAVTC